MSCWNVNGVVRLVIASKRTDISVYGHLAPFVRHAPKLQLDAFWRLISSTINSEISDMPVWLNTAGGGVAWLHVRFDSRPKFYGYSPYKTV